MKNIREKVIDQFRDTMKFIMRNEILFTNSITPKAFVLLKNKGGDIAETHIGMRGLYETEPDNRITTLEEGRVKISLGSDNIEDFKQSVIADGHDLISLCVVDVYEIEGDSSFVYTMYNDFLDDNAEQFEKKIEIHKLVLGETQVAKDGSIGEKRSKLSFNHA